MNHFSNRASDFQSWKKKKAIVEVLDLSTNESQNVVQEQQRDLNSVGKKEIVGTMIDGTQCTSSALESASESEVSQVTGVIESGKRARIQDGLSNAAPCDMAENQSNPNSVSNTSSALPMVSSIHSLKTRTIELMWHQAHRVPKSQMLSTTHETT